MCQEKPFRYKLIISHSSKQVKKSFKAGLRIRGFMGEGGREGGGSHVPPIFQQWVFTLEGGVGAGAAMPVVAGGRRLVGACRPAAGGSSRAAAGRRSSLAGLAVAGGAWLRAGDCAVVAVAVVAAAPVDCGAVAGPGVGPAAEGGSIPKDNSHFNFLPIPNKPSPEHEGHP